MAMEIGSRFDITLGAVERVAWSGEGVRLSSEAVRRMTQARRKFEALISTPGIVIYGVTSGYGQNAARVLTPEERLAHARMPPAGAAAAWGDPFPDRVVRGMVLARLANFVDGHAAVSPAVALAVAAMLDEHPLPSVPSRGQGGAGEILALSHLFWDVAANVPVAEKDVLSLINGSPVASALVADAAIAARRRLDIAVDVLALAAEGFRTPLSHFAVELETLWNNEHDAWALRSLRDRLGGFETPRRPYQAPVSFRILPRMLGLARRACSEAEEVARRSLAAVTDNPVFVAGDDETAGEAVSNGGFHNPYAPAAMDMLAVANANLCLIAGRLAAKLLDGAISRLPPQLQLGDDDAYLGCLPMAITGYEEEARLACQPTLLPGSESGGFGQNDVASPAPLAWLKQERTGVLLEASLAALAPIAMRALHVTGTPVPPLLSNLAQESDHCIPVRAAGVRYGPPTYDLAVAFRRRIYGGSA